VPGREILQFRIKKRLGLKFSIGQKNAVLENASVFKTIVFVVSKHLEVFNTSVFYKLKYSKNTLKYFGAKQLLL
jgi:hypothetical protein